MNTVYQVCGIKFEKGNKATDWTPSPEDIREDTNAAREAAQIYALDNLTPITLVSEAGTQVIAGNTITTSGATHWHNGVISTESATSGAIASWKYEAGSYALYMAGLGDGLGGATFHSIDYAIYCASSLYAIYEKGSPKGTIAIWGAPVVGDTLSVVYDNSTVKYFINGVLGYTSTLASADKDKTLYFDSSFHDGGGSKRLSQIVLSDYADYTEIRDTLAATKGTINLEDVIISNKPDDASNLESKLVLKNDRLEIWNGTVLRVVLGNL
jgi:hypothetical protein